MQDGKVSNYSKDKDILNKINGSNSLKIDY